MSFLGGGQPINQSKKRPQAPQRGWGGPLTSLISEAGGVGGQFLGTRAGIAAAIAAAPVTGGASVLAIPALSGLGSAVGSGTGRLIENKVRDNRGPGDRGETGKTSLDEALEEAKWSGLFGTAGGLISKVGTAGAGKAASPLARLISNNPITKGVTESADDVVKNVPGALGNLGGSMRNYQRKIVPGLRDSSGKGISKAVADAENAALDSVNSWFKGIGKSGQFTNAQEAIKSLSNTYKATKEAGAKLTKGEVDDMLSRIRNNIAANPSLKNNLTKSSTVTLKNIESEIKALAGKTRGDFTDFLPSINAKAKAIVEKGQVGSKEVQIWEEVRDALKGFVDEKLPDKSGVNKQISTLLGAANRLSGRITADAQAAVGKGITLGRFADDIAGPVLDVTGRGLQQVDKVARNPIAKAASSQGMAKLAGALLPSGQVGVDPYSESRRGQEEPEDVYKYTGGNIKIGNVDLGLPIKQRGEQAVGQLGMSGGSRYPLDQAIADYRANANNPKVQAQIMDYYDFVQKAEKSPSGTLTAAERKSQKQAATAMQGLNQLRGLYSGAGGGQNRLPGILSNIQGLAGGNSKADSYNKIRDSLTTALARAFGETGVLTDQDREVYKQALPRLEDTPEEAAIKLQYLEDMLAESSGGYGEETEQPQRRY